MQTNKIDLTKDIALLSFDADLCSCQRVTTDLDINKDGKPVTKGATVSIPVFDMTHTNGLKTNRERIRRYLQSVGINYAGAYIVVKSDVKEIMEKCKEFVALFNSEKQNLIQDYDFKLSEFIDAYEVDEVKPIIKKLAYSAEVFVDKHSLEMLPAMSLGATDPNDEEALLDKIAQAAFEDVRQSAFNIYKDRLLTKGTSPTLVTIATQTVIKDLLALKEKVIKLAFLNEGLGNLIKGFDAILSTLPKTGKIEKPPSRERGSPVHTLRDKVMCQELSDGSKSIHVLESTSDWVDKDADKSVTPLASKTESIQTPVQTPVQTSINPQNEGEMDDLFADEDSFGDWGITMAVLIKNFGDDTVCSDVSELNKALRTKYTNMSISIVTIKPSGIEAVSFVDVQTDGSLIGSHNLVAIPLDSFSF